MYAYIARQPIFNPSRETVAYELLYRDGSGNAARISDPDAANGLRVETEPTEVSNSVSVIERTSVAFDADAFSVYAVVVTETIETRYIAADGAAFRITVGYGEDAEIPAGATLAVRELTGEDAEGYMDQTEEALRGHQTLMGALLYHVPMVHHQNQVCVLDG